MPGYSIGAMREKLALLQQLPTRRSISDLTRTSTTATATTTAAHGFLASDYVTLAGSTIAGWNAKIKIVTVPTPTTFTFTCSGSLTTPATGTITVEYTSNGSGGQGANGVSWTYLDTVWAELIPQSATERLQLQAIQSNVQYRFRIWTKAGLDATMRVQWTPSWSSTEPARTLVLTGPPVPVEDGRQFLYLECTEVPA
jgi:SPP1 family predicted phage head-tail adaptor